MVFNYPPNPRLPSSAPENIDTAVVNAFYIVNTIHDFAYRYGFTEVNVVGMDYAALTF